MNYKKLESRLEDILELRPIEKPKEYQMLLMNMI